MSRFYKPTALALSLVAATCGVTALYARQSAKITSPGKTHYVRTDAESVRSDPLAGGKTLTTLSDHVVITSEDSTMNTEKATYNGATEIATAPTPLRLDDKQNTLTASHGVAYYSTRDADFFGNVVIDARPKQGGNNAPKGSLRREFKDPVRITCGHVRYNWGSKTAVLTENLIIKQKDRVLTGDKGYYDGVAETVTLLGNIKSRRPNGEKLDAPGPAARAVAVFKEGAEYVTVKKDPGAKSGKVRSEVPVQELPNGEYKEADGAAEFKEPTATPAPAAPATVPPANPAPAPASPANPATPANPTNPANSAPPVQP